MTRFIAAAVLVSALVYTCVALPREHDNELDEHETLTILPAHGSENSRFLLSFFNNLFRPKPWIPLPGLIKTTTTEAPADPEDEDTPPEDDNGGEDGDDPPPEGGDDQDPAADP